MTDQSLDQNPPVQESPGEPTDAEMNAFLEAEAAEEQENPMPAPTQEPEPEPEQEPKVEPEPEKEPAPAQEEQAQQNEHQRYKAMADEERIKRKETQKQIDQLRAENEQLKTTFNKILTRAQEQQEAQAPSFEEDPINALRHENEKLKTKVDQLDQDSVRSRQQAEADQKQQQFINTYRTKANEFKRATPDFDDAYNFLIENRMQEYEVAGYSKEQAEQLAMEDEAAIAANHLGKGGNPAEAIYKLAKLRGYSGKSIINDHEQIKENKDRLKENQAKIDNLERGLKASKTVNTGGANAKESLSLEDVAAMDDTEFSKLDWNKVLQMG